MPPNKGPVFRPPPKNQNSFVYILVIALIITSLYYIFVNPNQATVNENIEEVGVSEIIRQYQSDQLEAVEIEDNIVRAKLKDGREFVSYKGPGTTIADLNLNDPNNETPVTIINTEGSVFWREILSSIIPFLLVIGFLFFMMRQVSKSSSSAFSFGKSKAKMYVKDKKKTTFKNVAGLKEAKEELEEVVDFLRHGKKYTQIGAKIPKGVLLIGPPGTGKTLVARAVAGEADVPFFSISGSEFVEMFVGVGASRVRDLFQRAKRNAPCIIFIDEIDAVGRQRGGTGFGGGHDEREQTLNQILSEMDGFDNETGVIVMAATNRPDVLDAALMRPGRFDRRVIFDKPDIEDRKEILTVHGKNKPLNDKINLDKIARQTPGFSGADLENVMNEAAIFAARKNFKEISQDHLEHAVEKVTMGPEKKSRVLSDKERKITAYHEVGHAIVGHLLPNCDPVHKVSIVSRGMSLGVTWFLPEEDLHLYSESKFKDDLCSLLGGHVAEKVFFGEVTTGSSSDLQRASSIARRMVTEYGMSDELGPVIFGESHNSSFAGGADLGRSKNYSEEVAAKIDHEVNRILTEALKNTTDLITKNKTLMTKISEDLLKKETISRDEFLEYFGETKKNTPKTKVKKAVKKKSK